MPDRNRAVNGATDGVTSMQSSSRRAFFRGRRLPQTPWEQFCQRVRRTVANEFVDYRVEGTAGSGRITVEDATDIHHVRALCREYGVAMCLEGLAMASRPQDQPVVWVRLGKGMSRLARLDDSSNRWFVQPGCTLADLREAGFKNLDHLPGQLTVAAWLADRTLSDYAIGGTVHSGLEHVSLLLGDGQSVHLGPFAVDNTKPLDGLRLQQLVPALFRLASSAEARVCQDAEFWPARYRLDALMPVSGTTQNLAHLCLGHGGDLGWIEWAVLDADTLDARAGQAACFSTEGVAQMGKKDASSMLDRQIKALFDPDAVFPVYGQDL